MPRYLYRPPLLLFQLQFFGLPEPSLGFDIHSFAINQIARYLQTGGQEILDDPCLESGDCDFLPVLEVNDDAR